MVNKAPNCESSKKEISCFEYVIQNRIGDVRWMQLTQLSQLQVESNELHTLYVEHSH